jgi:hypothetical protein
MVHPRTASNIRVTRVISNLGWALKAAVHILEWNLRLSAKRFGKAVLDQKGPAEFKRALDAIRKAGLS